MKAQTVGIIGLGRIGASIALALKHSPLTLTVIGHDREMARAHQVMEQLEALDRVTRSLPGLAAEADILVLTVPVTELELTLRAIGEDVQPHALVLDMSQMKAKGIRWAAQYLRQGHYVGTVPVLAADFLADGRESIEAARADLFHNSVFCLMPSPETEPQAVETAINFGRLLGATPYFVDAMEFDSLVQGVTTIPGLLAAAMFNAVHKATGWRDMLRFADLPFAQTTLPLQAGDEVAHLALNDRAATLRWLDAFMEEMQQIRRWVQEGDEELLQAVLEKLDTERRKWLLERSENNWVEIQSPTYQGMSISEQLLGRWGRRDKKDEE
ncbi:MAG: prephenate dehydrogenase [Chloroflexi bacterium]|nr:MAG: prephenate dehydrogenase [Chloroflexota bacterium]